jgi:hypothetical protein
VKSKCAKYVKSEKYGRKFEMCDVPDGIKGWRWKVTCSF